MDFLLLAFADTSKEAAAPNVSLLAAAISLLSSAAIVFVTFWLNSKLEAQKAQYGEELTKTRSELDAKFAQQQARFNEELAAQRAERDARRSYEYEARKRLYDECEPLLFQLSEFADLSYHRILNMAGAAIAGNLGHDVNWLRDGYYLRSTMYRVLAPAACLLMIQARLTAVDLRLDERIAHQYRLAKLYYRALMADFEMAGMGRTMYTPNVADWQALRAKEPSRYWRQALVWGWLDRAASSMLVNVGTRSQIISFGEFDEAVRDERSPIGAAFQPVRDLFFEFSPVDRPILWRVLTVLAVTAEMIRRNAQAVDLEELLPASDAERIRRSQGDQWSDPLTLATTWITNEITAESVRRATSYGSATGTASL